MRGIADGSLGFQNFSWISMSLKMSPKCGPLRRQALHEYALSMDTISLPSRELELMYHHVLKNQWFEELNGYGEPLNEVEVPLLSKITVREDWMKLKKTWVRHFLSTYDEDYEGSVRPEEHVAEWPAISQNPFRRERLTVRTVRI